MLARNKTYTITINIVIDYYIMYSFNSLSLATQQTALNTVQSRIIAAKEKLAATTADAQRAIALLEQQSATIEEDVNRLQSLLAPIRKLPQELVRIVFTDAFAENPAVAWILAAVCRSWRTLALSTHCIWSKVRV